MIQKPVHWFEEETNDWFLFDIGLRHEKVNLPNDLEAPELINNHQFQRNEKAKG